MSFQESSGGKFLPAFFVEPVELGQEIEGELPLHMTYFPPVKTAFRPQHADMMRQYVNAMPPFIATVGENNWFGDKRNVPVREMVHTGPLLAVHRGILAALQHLPHPTEYSGASYRPHISIDHADTRVETGDAIEIGGFSIVEKYRSGAPWRVMAKIGLRGADMTTDAKIIKRIQE